jgi:aminoglycoside adenylyltransferase-like protein
LSERHRAGSIQHVVNADALARARDYLAKAQSICGGQLAAGWLHGGSTFADHSIAALDVDVGLVVREAVREQGELLNATAIEHKVDGLFVRSADMPRSDRPVHAFDDGRPLVGWAVYRSHWLAGQYVSLFGREPREWVVPPQWGDVLADLDREVEHFERHVVEGDAADPYEATVAHLNGCRVLYTMTTHDPVISKRSSGHWGLSALPADWHPAIEAALRSYDARGSDGDIAVLRASMPRFVDYVRGHVPIVEPRPDGPPRWS